MAMVGTRLEKLSDRWNCKLVHRLIRVIEFLCTVTMATISRDTSS